MPRCGAGRGPPDRREAVPRPLGDPAIALAVPVPGNTLLRSGGLGPADFPPPSSLVPRSSLVSPVGGAPLWRGSPVGGAALRRGRPVGGAALARHPAG